MLLSSIPCVGAVGSNFPESRGTNLTACIQNINILNIDWEDLQSTNIWATSGGFGRKTQWFWDEVLWHHWRQSSSPLGKEVLEGTNYPKVAFLCTGHSSQFQITYHDISWCSPSIILCSWEADLLRGADLLWQQQHGCKVVMNIRCGVAFRKLFLKESVCMSL